MKTISKNKMHGGVQAVYEHRSDACDCDMRVAVFTPEGAENAPALRAALQTRANHLCN